MYDTRQDCPTETLRFPTRPIADATVADMEMPPAPRRDSGEAATIYDEGIATRQWDQSRSQWIVTIESYEDLPKVAWGEKEARHTYRFPDGCPVKISSLMLNRKQSMVWHLLRGSLTEFRETMSANATADEFPEGQWTFAGYANLWQESRDYELAIMMTMAPEKRMHVYSMIQKYSRLMEVHHCRAIWFRAVVVGSSSLTGEMRVRIIGGAVVDTPEGTILDAASEGIRWEVAEGLIGNEEPSGVPAVMSELFAAEICLCA